MRRVHDPDGAASRARRPDVRVHGIDRCEYSQSQLMLRLCLRLAFEPPSPAHPTLLVEHDAGERAYPALVARTARRPLNDRGEWSWRGSFSVPSELFSGSPVQFSLRMHEQAPLPLALGLDCDFTARPLGVSPAGGSTWPYALRRTALLFTVTCQLGLAQVWIPETGLASESSIAGTGAETTPDTPGPEEEPKEPTPQAPPQPPLGPGGPGPEQPPQPPDPVPEIPPAPAPLATASGAAAEKPSSTAANAPSTAPSVESPASSATKVPHPTAKGVATPRRHPWRDARERHRSRPDRARPQRARGVRQAPGVPDASAGPALPEPTSLTQELPSTLLAVAEDRPPAYLVPIYEAAGRRYGVPWRVLAAINAIESDYGRNLAVSSAGAVGWMQFMPSTWREWAVDADHDGHLSPYSPRDAIFTAARYLQASGAAHDLPGAIFAYNHADWYVTEVLLRAEKLGSLASIARLEKGYALPLDARYMRQLGRTDDGVDVEMAPDAALVYSITPGVVSAVASDPAGFGPNYPVIGATGGSLAGAHIYYGHVAQSLVRPGQLVSAGQPIAIMGHTGDAVLLGHGHIEIGFSDAGGDPLSHHGAQARTPAGDVMRSFLVTLSGSFGVDNA
jgi:murein DD-endopeptidase MepM/ murein hydrolase activator NlpD